MDELNTKALFDLGYAIPAYSPTYPPYVYKHRELYYLSTHRADIRLPGLSFPVAKLEDVKRETA